MRPPACSALRFPTATYAVPAHNKEPQRQRRSQGIDQRAIISASFLTANERELHLGRCDAHAQGRHGYRTFLASPPVAFLASPPVIGRSVVRLSQQRTFPDRAPACCLLAARRTLKAGRRKRRISGAMFCVFGLRVIWGDKPGLDLGVLPAASSQQPAARKKLGLWAAVGCGGFRFDFFLVATCNRQPERKPAPYPSV